MNQAALLRAAGAYAAETFRETGNLLHQAAVLAGLRLQDGFLYTPDPGLVPRDGEQLYRRLRLCWREAAWMDRELGACAEDAFGVQLPALDWGDGASWADPLPLACRAAALLPDDARVRLTLVSNWIRRREEERAAAELQQAAELAQRGRAARHAVLLGMAAVAEATGDCAAVLQHASAALEERPDHPVVQLSFVGYTISCAAPDALAMALRSVRGLFVQPDRARLLRAYLARDASYYALRMRNEPDLSRIAWRELGLEPDATQVGAAADDRWPAHPARPEDTGEGSCS